MDPLTVSVEIELGAILLSIVGAVATWLHSRQQKARRRQRERHHQEMRALQERQHRERMAALRLGERIVENCVEK